MRYIEENGDTAEIEVDIKRLVLNNTNNQDHLEILNAAVDDIDSIDSIGESHEIDNSLEMEIEQELDTRASNDVSNEQPPPTVTETFNHYDIDLISSLIKDFVRGVNDRGGREKVDPATTLVTDIVKDLSSKNSEAAWEIMKRYMHTHSNFYELVHTCTSDQEFMPSLYRKLFLSLHPANQSKKLPLILPLAMGHAVKSMSCSMLACYRPFFDELFKAIGVKLNSPKHQRYLDGKHIKETVKFVIGAIETLRSAEAKLYLNENGNTQCIVCSDGKQRSPRMILMESILSCDRDNYETVIVIDEFGRPQSITQSPNSLSLARHFQNWVETKVSVVSDVRVGPSGFVHGDKEKVEKMREASLALGDNNNDCPNEIPDQYRDIWDYPYRQIPIKNKNRFLNSCYVSPSM